VSAHEDARVLLDFEGELLARSILRRGFAVREDGGQLRELADVPAEAVGGRHLRRSTWRGRVRLRIGLLEGGERSERGL